MVEKNVQDSVKRKMKSFRRWIKIRSPENRLEYVIDRNETEQVKKREREEKWRKIGQDLQEDLKGTKTLLYNIAKMIEKARRRPQTQSKMQMEI